MTIRVRSNYLWAIIILCILALTAVIYWPVHRAGFVWDDKVDFYNYAWLRHGSEWKHHIFNHFNDWVNYFRPLVIALYVAEVRVFDVVAGTNAPGLAGSAPGEYDFRGAAGAAPVSGQIERSEQKYWSPCRH